MEGRGHSADKQMDLDEAVRRHVRPGDTVQVVLGHSRWTAAARALARCYWGESPGLTLVMLSLGSLGALFFRGGIVRKVVTSYSGDSFPTYTPNPVFQEAYSSGKVEVEHWSILTFTQRLEAAARGLPAMTTGSLSGSSMEANDSYTEVETDLGRIGLLAPLAPDVALLHAPVADSRGNVAMSGPLMEETWGAWAARRGAIVTAERVVDDISPWGHLTRLPGHRVLAVVEAPFGAHPGGLFAPGLPVASYGEDVPFWCDARRASRGDLDSWARRWVLEPATQADYLERLGEGRLDWLRSRADPESWRADAAEHPVDEGAPLTEAEAAAALGAREVEARIVASGADAVLAGAGLANLSAWVGVARARAAGSDVCLTAELGMWGYTPTPADPYIFNHRVFPRTPMLTDCTRILGMVVGGPGTTTIGCLGAAQLDKAGNINSTQIPDGPFLVGSGGGNDVASRADECIVVTPAARHRLLDSLGYVTSPGGRVTTVATDKGVLRKREGELVLSAVPEGAGSVEDRVREARGACGWDLRAERRVAEIAAVTLDEAVALRRYDPERLFLGS
jgi:acyl CoA:acetate/3-ketoacid CoA transferase alpha subunit/acyl CoA:acetate/3-ketoacid CoA transferase beta subunit